MFYKLDVENQCVNILILKIILEKLPNNQKKPYPASVLGEQKILYPQLQDPGRK